MDKQKQREKDDKDLKDGSISKEELQKRNSIITGFKVNEMVVLHWGG